MGSYVEDNLVKYHCNSCDGDFILSEYQVGNADKNIICPYCYKESIEEVFNYDYSEYTIDIPGCMVIGHHTDIKEEMESYEYTWGRIIQHKIDELKNKLVTTM